MANIDIKELVNGLPEGAEINIVGIKLTNTKTGETEIINVDNGDK